MGLECRKRYRLKSQIWSQHVDDIERLDEMREKRTKDCSLGHSYFEHRTWERMGWEIVRRMRYRESCRDAGGGRRRQATQERSWFTHPVSSLHHTLFQRTYLHRSWTAL